MQNEQCISPILVLIKIPDNRMQVVGFFPILALLELTFTFSEKGED